MAFSLTATCSGTTLNLSNKSPYGLLYAKGMSGAVVRRVTERGPAQVGDTDVGFRLEPRIIELTIGFYATTDAILDGYRDSLTQFFKPLTSTVINLTVTRDDGAIRQLDCYTVDEIKIDWVKEHRAGHFHNATIKLRAPEPAYYNPTPGTVTVSGSAGTATDWYLAGGAIGTSSVLMSGGTPTQGQAWSYAGSIAHTTSYTLAIRATQESFGTADKYMFYVDNTSLLENDIVLRAATSRYAANTSADGGGDLGTAFMPAGTTNYYIRHGTSGLDGIDPSGIGLSTSANDVYAAGTASGLVTVAPSFPPSTTRPIGGTARRWRSDATNTAASRWSGTILLYALYSPGLNATQIAALDTYMAGSVGGTVSIATYISYAGDLAEYPSDRKSVV